MSGFYWRAKQLGWTEEQWKHHARALVSEARLHAQMAERNIYKWPAFLSYMESENSKRARVDARAFRAREEELRHCTEQQCEVAVKNYYDAIEFPFIRVPRA